MLGDIRFALRTLAKRPSFAVAAMATLALGIAVNTIAFSLLNSLVFRPMPVPNAGRVVRLSPVDATGRRGNLFSYDVSAFDPITMAGVSVLLTAVAAGACYIPARRAARLGPVSVLRMD